MDPHFEVIVGREPPPELVGTRSAGKVVKF
jgi:hypothetical protein